MTLCRNIFAELTPPGRGGISTLALLGPAAETALAQAFRPARGGSLPGPGQILYGHVVDAGGQAVDEVLCHRAASEGDAVEFEIHCHGGPAAVQGVSGRLRDLGFEAVEWTEYLATRAGAAGTSQVVLESELLLPNLATLPAAMLVVVQRNGLLAGAVEDARRLASSGRTAEAAAAVRRLVDAYQKTGRWIERPPRVAILGAANVGKSSLMNRLAGEERAIVTETPGTTRDVVTETVSLGGLPVVLADTAGLREQPVDVVEQLGVERARAEALQADTLLYLVDLARPLGADEERWLAERPRASVVVGTKADLAGGDIGTQRTTVPSAVQVLTSSVTGQGIDELVMVILAALGFRWPAADEAVPFSARQASLLREAREAIARGDNEGASDRLSAILEGM